MINLPKYVKTAILKYADQIGLSTSLEGEWKVVRAATNGDSFSSDLLRVSIPVLDINGNAPTIREPVSQKNLIAKIAPIRDFRRDMYKITTIFSREMFMYTTLLPDFEKFQKNRLKQLNISKPIFDNYPELIAKSNALEEEFLLLSDVSEEGFVGFDRTKGVDLETCKEIFKVFARLHAVSFVYQAVDRSRFLEVVGDNLQETLFTNEKKDFADFLVARVDVVKEKITNYCDPEPIDKKVIERLQHFRENYKQIMKNACTVKEYAVICHGDSWISNFMCKKNKDKTMDIKIVDYQYSRFTTPVVDLSYFIGCSTVKETRVHLPELLQIYYDSLMEEIRLLGGISAPNELYPYEVFQSHCQKFMIFGFGMACMSLHSITCKPDEMPDVVSLLEKCTYEDLNKYSEILCRKPAYIKRITELARDMVAFGYL